MNMKVTAQPDLRDPFLVAAFGGWGDAASVATTSASFFLRNRENVRIAELDPEDYFVFTDTRPVVRQRRRGQRRIRWPALTLVGGIGQARDSVVLVGPEPQLRWRSFAHEIAGFWRTNGKGGPVLLLGAFLAGVSHAAPVTLTGFATTDELRARLFGMNVHPSGYEGPTGVHSVVLEALVAEGVPCASVWAAVPHYLAAVPNPKACAAILRVVDRLLDLDLDLAEMDEAARSFERQVGLALTHSGQSIGLAAGTKTPADAATPEPAADEPLPATDELLKGVEEFLRKQR